MDRQQFLHSFAAGCVCCGAAALLKPFAAATMKAPETPLDKKYAFAQTWVRRMMYQLDHELDEPTRNRIMQNMGRVCYTEYQGPRPADPVDPAKLDEVIKYIAERNGEDSIRREGRTIFFNYVKNSEGLRVSDGYCLCPVVETGPEGLSGTFCHCSVGYVGEMFSRFSGTEAKVELLESLKRGGKTCRFKITI